LLNIFQKVFSSIEKAAPLEESEPEPFSEEPEPCQTGLKQAYSLFGWLVADGWCWFVLREEYCWLVAGGWFVLREKYCWLVADKPSEQALVQ
jgi:hypothetical protein